MDYAVIDANLNRAKEGLRVVEDVCRFILENKELTEKIQKIRHSVNVDIPHSLLVNSRTKDIAREREIIQRKSTRDIVIANLKRVTEALRVLEEFLDDGNFLKELRYDVYLLEKEVYSKLNVKIPFEKDLYVLSDTVEVLKKAIDDGARIVQLRDKTSSQEIIRFKSAELVTYKKIKDFIFILNDDYNLALEVGADGVHIGQEDGSISSVRSVVGNDFIIGRTTDCLEKGLIAEKEGANYISVGPVYATPAKLGRPGIGLDYIKQANAEISIPFVTIGGIDMGNIKTVLDAGAKTIGIIRAVDRAKEMIEIIKNN
jgi:thiamine-phosphate pyrophosphorylase